MKHYCIGDTELLMDPGPVNIEESPYTLPFLSSEEPKGEAVLIRWEKADLSFLRNWELELYTGGYEIRKGEGRRFLLRHWMTQRYAYGLYLDELFGKGPICLYCNELLEGELTLTAAQCLSSMGIHHRLLQQESVVLHASYVAYGGKGILFTAPSQTGKSTQAELWHRYRGAEVVNGDRALLFRRNGLWYTGGYIASGSSGICKNKILPLGTIVLLEQGKENEIRVLTDKERHRALLAATESFHWSTEDLDLVLAALGKLAREACMVRLRCRPDEDAVRTLENYLERESQC